MNFLAHLHLAQFAGSNLLGNLLGDFVKGDPYPHYPKVIADGIRLHRRIDSFTDQHDLLSECKMHFPVELRRFAPIALDLFWDHCLARHWSNYHPQTLEDFVVLAQRAVNDAPQVALPHRFVLVNDKIWSGRWLQSYQSMQNIEFALSRMSQRSPRMAPLSECGMTLARHYPFFVEQFAHLYPEVMTYALNQQKELASSIV
ncbi:ACP phosphodiesterase [Vibrio navarrensis]|uniref:ACP phosphodiesterase n=1 Tax=Vibrio navarrensis TaxID=29495 RepID=A0A099MHU3_9VIBR|nr:ACP phosphodiesterase [Vibrio navarrensis]KGK11936.1 ACP phosphodiesterase [Vibrio navarrensis]KGK19316.1 ACP phosphodiesterase [Vibrio navarrensis]MBE4581285.1 ACP phosphodiesterase [Vibrio navarrensis]MBE4586126.1 ACP phosphodiesterase [Vibrio navarrensis]MBE4607735.1 ACP phosphodiesterase [Vibrio navarrensis]